MFKLKYKIYLFVFFLILSAPSMAQEILTWENCVQEALAKHPDLIAASEQVNQSRADRNISISNILPQISSQIIGKRAKTSSSESNTYSYTVSGEQLLFDGLKTISEIKSSACLLDAQEYNYLVVSSNIRLNLRIAFAALLRAQELITLTEEISLRREENLKLVRIRYEAGREHNGAVLTAQADLAQAKFEAAQAKRNLSLVQRQLIKELGRDKKTPISVEGSFDVDEIEEEQPDWNILADSAPLLRELIMKKESARFDLVSAKADFLPEVYLNGSIGKTDSDWPPGKDVWSAGMTMSLPIFEGGSRVVQVKKTKSQLIEAQANERSGRDSVIYTLEETWKSFRDAVETVLVKEKFLDAALERAKIANAQYSSGLISFDDWIIIENNLVSAKKNFLDAREDLLVYQAYWIQAKGGTLEYVKK